MLSIDQVRTAAGGGGNVVGPHGEKIGRIGQIYLDDTTGEPDWVTAKLGMFGTAETSIPLAGATAAGTNVQGPYGKEQVKDAPRVAADGSLSQDQEAELYRFYGLNDTAVRSSSGLTAGGGAVPPVRTDTSGPMTDTAMTRSEERAVTSVETVPVERVRLDTTTVTENQQVTGEVRKEQIELDTTDTPR